MFFSSPLCAELMRAARGEEHVGVDASFLIPSITLVESYHRFRHPPFIIFAELARGIQIVGFVTMGIASSLKEE